MIEKKSNSKDTIILERRYIPHGAVIMKEGDLGSTAFLIQSGMVRVVAGRGTGREVELAVMGMGEIFGEMALVFDEPRTATVIAVEDCNLIVINRDTLQHKLNKSDPTVKAIVPMLMKRIIQSNKALLGRDSSVVELIDTATAIYENVLNGLSPPQKQSFQGEVLPKLEAYLDAVRQFRERYGNEKS